MTKTAKRKPPASKVAKNSPAKLPAIASESKPPAMQKAGGQVYADDLVLRVCLPGTPARRHAVTPAPSKNKQQLELMGAHGESPDETKARLVLSPAYANALTAKNFAQGGIFDGSETQLDITACTAEIVDKMTAIEAGDTREIERQLIGQATALQAMFGEMSRRAAMNIGKHMEATETYMRLALRAQSQARATLETLAEIKNPRPVYINPGQVNHATGNQQVNNATGPQQVNNGGAPVRESKRKSNKLLTVKA